MQYMNMKATLLARTKEARDDRSIVEISNHSNVHTDAARLEMQGLIESSDDNAISVPYEAVEILLPLAQVA
jgi:predicted transcriptional regulator